MKILINKEPPTCEDLSKKLGYPVRSMTTYPDGTIELDVDADKLSDADKEKVIADAAVILSLSPEATGSKISSL